MQVEFLSRFSKDLDKIKSKTVKHSIIKIVEQVESVASLNEISNVKKLAGYQNAFRIRTGQYRIGIFVEKDLVQFARVVHRKDIYKMFP